ncbi:Nuclear pore complex protein Nup54 [Hypsibius exemplaris]|uniref:Nuclear pore complex protein Nup54 n=1 Tax=Hypsibius exemplaris TaxID=2072580 RepID=A0A1W0X2I5_HYPEX|nr:Nuclear pore complex protein Nup54 [Hypsibius exemplaris]
MFNFNTPATTAASTGFAFGAPATTAAASTSFFGAGFGTTPAAAPATTGLFGQPAPAQPQPQAGFFSGFGTTPQQPTAFTGFGQPQQPQPQQQNMFGTFGAAQPAQQQQPSLSFGGGMTAAQPQQQTNLTAEADYAARLAACVQNPFLFGDERDQVLAKFNSVQATMGCGKAYFALNQPPLPMNPENVFCKWKCVVYMPKKDYISEDGVVRLIFNKSGADVYDVRGALAELIHKMLGERPNVQVEVDGVNPLPNNKSELMLHVLERLNDGNVRKVPASELHSFLLQPTQKAHLQAMLVEDVQAKLNLTKDMEKQYLEKVPPGLSSYMWFQAQRDNPDPENLLPMPVVGFEAMYASLKKEVELATMSKNVCQQVGADVKQLEKKVEENKQTALSYQDKLDRLMIRQLHVSSTQPVVSRIGQPLTSFETNLCDHISQMNNLMEAPERNLKNRAQELTANIQLHDRYLTERSKRQPRVDLRSLTETEKEDMGKACELLLTVLDACKDKIRDEREVLMKLMYEDSFGTQ